ncbi:MAG: hypothetical protein PCFJNLEI_03461 [Verrucomicrobiae bacterium]|nr:hypothetical protein [Verrucomicrobiae bacterium]
MSDGSSWRWIGLLLVVVNTFGATAAELPALKFPEPPRLATTVEELATLKAAPDFAAKAAEAVRKADALVANPPELPAGNGGWIFDYACPQDAAQLRPLSLTEHECPKCRTRYTNEVVVLAHRCRLHYASEQAAVALGWAYAYTGDEKYVPGVKRILLKLAGDYATYPDRQDRWGQTGNLAVMGGRRYVQSLDEAVGAIHLARAYDLTRNSPAWTDAERREIEQGFFRSTAESLLRFPRRSNHQTWYNAGLIAIAVTLADAELLRRVLDMPFGVLEQLDKNIGKSGLWYEGAMVYHNYALQPLLMTADMTRRVGLTLHTHPKLLAMITGPLRAVYPDGSYPAINDSDPAHVRMFEPAFKWAGIPFVVPPLPSEVLEDAGLVALRAGGTCVFVDYGPHGDEHGHPDKLNIMLYALGRELILDPGRITYSVPEYKTWARTTVAHNTVVVDGKNQEETTGELWWFGSNACLTATADAYPGSLLKRFVVLNERLLVDVFRVEREKPAQLDWVVHCRGNLVAELQPTTQTLGTTNGYQHLRELQTGQVARVTFAPAPDKKLTVHFAGEEPIWTGVGIGYRLDDRVPFVLRRRQSATTTFVTVYDWSAEVEKVEQLPGDAVVKLRLTGTNRTTTVTLDFRQEANERLIWREQAR